MCLIHWATRALNGHWKMYKKINKGQQNDTQKTTDWARQLRKKKTNRTRVLRNNEPFQFHLSWLYSASGLVQTHYSDTLSILNFVSHPSTKHIPYIFNGSLLKSRINIYLECMKWLAIIGHMYFG